MDYDRFKNSSPSEVRIRDEEYAVSLLETIGDSPFFEDSLRKYSTYSSFDFQQASDPIMLDPRDLPPLIHEGLQFFNGITSIRDLKANLTSWQAGKNWSLNASFVANNMPISIASASGDLKPNLTIENYDGSQIGYNSTNDTILSTLSGIALGASTTFGSGLPSSERLLSGYKDKFEFILSSLGNICGTSTETRQAQLPPTNDNRAIILEEILTNEPSLVSRSIKVYTSWNSISAPIQTIASSQDILNDINPKSVSAIASFCIMRSDLEGDASDLSLVDIEIDAENKPVYIFDRSLDYQSWRASLMNIVGALSPTVNEHGPSKRTN